MFTNCGLYVSYFKWCKNGGVKISKPFLKVAPTELHYKWQSATNKYVFLHLTPRARHITQYSYIVFNFSEKL